MAPKLDRQAVVCLACRVHIFRCQKIAINSSASPYILRPRQLLGLQACVLLHFDFDLLPAYGALERIMRFCWRTWRRRSSYVSRAIKSQCRGPESSCQCWAKIKFLPPGVASSAEGPGLAVSFMINLLAEWFLITNKSWAQFERGSAGRYATLITTFARVICKSLKCPKFN